jgi:vacuolar-type H+-ATPase subunit H
LKDNFEETRRQITEEADSKARKNLSSADRRIHEENRQLVKNMNMQKNEVELMKKDRYKFRSNNSELNRELEIA